jgi:23S rRNA (pseudouridine1915-N3)-methyltransferase
VSLKLLLLGSTHTSYLKEAEKEYLKRLQKYTQLTYTEIGNLKQASKWSVNKLKIEEGKLILSKLKAIDWVILLDERGKEYSSPEFANYLEQNMSHRASIVFVIGGAYGFSEEVYNRANAKLAISKMTLSHRMVRTFFLEQLYRAFTILRGDPYHH